jgi:sodium-dependent dicarboxylate transporter 2/3/5
MSDPSPPEREGEATAHGRRRLVALAAGPWAAAVLLALPNPGSLSDQGQAVGAILVWMGIWWISEAVPIPVTALLPIVLYPLLGVMPTSRVTAQYANHFVFLLLGGFLLAAMIRRWRLDRRIALWTILRVGTGQRRLVLGFMLAAAAISMWISNTATTMLMFPIALGVIARIEEGSEGAASSRFAVAVLLGTAYAASIGGMGTLIGTFPNVVFAGISAGLFPDAPPVTMVEWMRVGIPVVVVLLPVTWLYLVRVALPLPAGRGGRAGEVVRDEWRKLGSMSRGEWMTMGLFAVTALLWIFRSPIALGPVTVPGWGELFGGAKWVTDAVVALGAVVLAFCLPVSVRRREFLLDWRAAEEVPWGILILFGGGFALAAGFESSGLSRWLGTSLTGLQGVPPIVAIAAVCLLLTFLTEVTSNTATTTTMLPILAAAAVASGMHPYLLMMPAAISASCAFMLPIATPPNAIVFGSGRVSIARMARVGLWLNLLGVVVVTLVLRLIGLPALGVGAPPVPPLWAH